VNDCEIARRLGVPRTTVRDWRAPRYARRELEACWRCWRPTRPIRFTPAGYTELLGLYLGDGHITAMPRTERLRISLDARYSTIVDEAETLVARCFPSNRVGRFLPTRNRMVVVFINRTGKYEYLSYDFGNRSADIRDLFIATCARVGVESRSSGASVRIYRRPSVAVMQENVGGKS
jgi:hypothetical protein